MSKTIREICDEFYKEPMQWEPRDDEMAEIARQFAMQQAAIGAGLVSSPVPQAPPTGPFLLPKFKVGDLVRVYFDGQVEGVEVRVHRDLYVIGLKGENDPQRPGLRVRYTYWLQQTPLRDGMVREKVWELAETKLESLEPVVEAAQKARDGVQ